MERKHLTPTQICVRIGLFFTAVGGAAVLNGCDGKNVTDIPIGTRVTASKDMFINEGMTDLSGDGPHPTYGVQEGTEGEITNNGSSTWHAVSRVKWESCVPFDKQHPSPKSEYYDPRGNETGCNGQSNNIDLEIVEDNQ